jgi:hypothetical protein
MQRTTAPNNVASKPAYASGGESPGYYTDETTGGSGTPGTLVSAADMNLMQEEIANAIEDIGGLTLDSADDAQLAKALGAMKTGATTTGTDTCVRTRVLLASTTATASGDNSAMLASTLGEASGNLSAVVASSLGTASGIASSVIASVAGDASGASSVCAGSTGSEASGDKSVILASTNAEVGDDGVVALGYSASGISHTGLNQNLTIILVAQTGQIIGKLLKLTDLGVYADNTAAVSGGLNTGDVYRTSTGELRIVIP